MNSSQGGDTDEHASTGCGRYSGSDETFSSSFEESSSCDPYQMQTPCVCPFMQVLSWLFSRTSASFPVLQEIVSVTHFAPAPQPESVPGEPPAVPGPPCVVPGD